jgi:hypothetical protein
VAACTTSIETALIFLEQLADERRAVGRLGGARNLNQAPSAKGKKKKYNNKHTIF